MYYIVMGQNVVQFKTEHFDNKSTLRKDIGDKAIVIGGIRCHKLNLQQ